MYSSAALSSVTREIEKFRMDLVGIQEIRWEFDDISESGIYILFFGEDNVFANKNRLFVHRRVRSVIK